jgi:biopolymer transport protein ExbB
MATNNKSKSVGIPRIWINLIVVTISFVIAYFIFYNVLGNPANFEGGDPIKGHPIDGNTKGLIFKGGPVVVVNITLLILAIVFFFERLFTLIAAQGKGGAAGFLNRVKNLLDRNEIDQAIKECDKQKGSVANVIRHGLMKYDEMQKDTTLDKDTKVLAISKEIEEATTLELPMLQANLIILATVASIATLMGLLGTVIGMIKAFSALATAGAPDAVALSTGISEALINTAGGVGISAIAIVFYNLFSNMVDGITFRIEEAGFTITQNFAAKNK